MRPFSFGHGNGAYLPIADISKARVFAIGFKGWVSMDIFDRNMGSELSAGDRRNEGNGVMEEFTKETRAYTKYIEFNGSNRVQYIACSCFASIKQ